MNDPRMIETLSVAPEEYWLVIDEFPDYEISNTGLILNSDTNRLIKQSKTQQGAMKVGLVGDDNRQYTRSVKVLVATAFVEGHTEIFNTPINLDGNQENNVAENLAWRPRWFAWKYTKQFDVIYDYYVTRPVINENTGERYTNILEASRAEGLLMKDVLVSCHNAVPIFPFYHIFNFEPNSK